MSQVNFFSLGSGTAVPEFITSIKLDDTSGYVGAVE